MQMSISSIIIIIVDVDVVVGQERCGLDSSMLLSKISPARSGGWQVVATGNSRVRSADISLPPLNRFIPFRFPPSLD